MPNRGITLSIDQDRLMDQPVPNSARKTMSREKMARKLGMEQAQSEMEERGSVPTVSPMDDMVTGIVVNAGLADNESSENEEVFSAFVDGWRSVAGESEEDDMEEQESGELIERGAALTAESKRPSDSVFI